MFVRLVDKILGKIIIRWKDYRTLQTVFTVMKPGVKKSEDKLDRRY